MASTRCVVRSCIYSCSSSTNRPPVTFHCFPKEPDLRSEWARILRLHARQITDYSRACSLHFNPEDLERRRKTKKYRLLPLEPIPGESSAATAARATKRRKKTINIPTGVTLGTTYLNPIRLEDVDFDAHKRIVGNESATDKHFLLTGTSSSSVLTSNAAGTQTSVKSEPADESDTFDDSTLQFDPSPSDKFRKKFYKNSDSHEFKPHVLTRNDERQFLVSEGQLRLLLNRCPKCGRQCYHTAATSDGVDATFSVDCSHCGDVINWSTQPEIELSQPSYSTGISY